MIASRVFFAIFSAVSRWLLVSPVLLIRFLVRSFRFGGFWVMSYRHEIICRNCGAAISLVGIWRCRCGYTYKGHLLRPCPVCDALPRMARCFRCGVTEKLPER
jgi:hypothetical protein